jgi:type II secretory pathway component GspD/PulD (secretin)
LINNIETGSVLDAQATVSADRRYVTMTLRPSVGRLLGIQTFGFQVGAAAGEGAFVQLPSITRQVVRTTVSVPDGGTLLIGGQKLAGEIEIEGGVPVLSKIPILKRFYSSRTLVKDEQVLLILIKPKIIIRTEAEQEAFPSFSQG